MRRSPFHAAALSGLLAWLFMLLASTAQAERAQKDRFTPTGALVIAANPAVRVHAEALARAVYVERTLRPTIDEKMARVLVGHAAEETDALQKEVAGVVATLAAVQDDTVRRRLLVSLGTDLHAQLIVFVEHAGAGPTARVVKMPEETYVAVTLAAKGHDWSDAVGILRGLVSSPPPGPRSKPAGTSAAAVPEDDEDDWDLLTSPWFWGGLGVVLTVGVTVLVLSQTALNEPDVVMLDGRISP
jgi:hypothetical protein